MTSVSLRKTDSILEAALAYAVDKKAVFPCRPQEEEGVDRTGAPRTFNAKSPYTSRGFKDASIFPHVIERWWKDYPGALIGMPTGARTGVWVLDVDPRHNGVETLAALEREHGTLPDTACVRTASGGQHYYFNHVDGIRCNAGKLGDGLDVRGDDGYVIAPGSVTADGTYYEWLRQKPVLDAPQWLLDIVVAKPVPAAANDNRGTVVSAGENPAYCDAAINEILDTVASLPHGERNTELFASAAALGNLVGAGATTRSEAQQALENIVKAWPNFAKSKDTIKNGLDTGEKTPRQIPEPSVRDDGTKPLPDGTIERLKAADGAKKAASDSSTEHEQAKPAFTITPYIPKDPTTLPRREWLFGGHYIRKYVSVTVSPGGLGKTSNSIVEALSMTSGKSLLDDPDQGGLRRRFRVWLFNGEDPRDEMDRRIEAARLYFKLKPEDVAGHMFLDIGREQELVIVREDKKSGVKTHEPVVEAIVNQIYANKIDVLIADPFVSTHSVNENDNGAIDKVAKQWAQIADRTNCAIDLVHHLRKLNDRAATIDDARGAVSLIGAARSVRVLNQMSPEQAKEAGVPPHDVNSYFHIVSGKSNMVKRDNSRSWRKLESVSLGNCGKLNEPSDYVGVVTKWNWPSKEETAEKAAGEVTADQMGKILVRLKNQTSAFARNSSRWAGFHVMDALELNRESKDGRDQAAKILGGLIVDGTLVVKQEEDHRRHKSNVVRPRQE